MRRFLYLAVGLLGAPPAGAASFDCAKASTPVEQIIRDDSELSRRDETLTATLAGATAATLNPQALQRATPLARAPRQRRDHRRPARFL
jgi:uncharacterized protein